MYNPTVSSHFLRSAFLPPCPHCASIDWDCSFVECPSAQRYRFCLTRSRHAFPCLRFPLSPTNYGAHYEHCWFLFDITDCSHQVQDVCASILLLISFWRYWICSTTNIHHARNMSNEYFLAPLIFAILIGSPTSQSKMVVGPYIFSSVVRRIPTFYGRCAVPLLPLP